MGKRNIFRDSIAIIMSFNPVITADFCKYGIIKKLIFAAMTLFISANLFSFEMEFENVSVKCPIDGTKFQIKKIKNHAQFATMLDGQGYGILISPEPVAKCPNDGFILYKNEFTEEELQALKQFTASQEYQLMSKHETDYWLAAKLQQKLSAAEEEILSSMQRSTWEAYNLLDYEKYRRYAGETIIFIDKMQKPSDENIFLKGELCRRTGNFKEASKTFTLLKKNAAGNQSMMKKTNQQMSLIEAGITSVQRTEK